MTSDNRKYQFLWELPIKNEGRSCYVAVAYTRDQAISMILDRYSDMTRDLLLKNEPIITRRYSKETGD